MDKHQDIAYCGLYCRICAVRSRVPQLATKLDKTLKADGWEYFGEFMEPNFNIFWGVLRNLAAYETTCPDCRGGCGDPDCAIRICAKERGVDFCSLCADFPCEKIEGLAKSYPNLIADARRLAEIGPEKWRTEQEKRRETGFCYCDIRIDAPCPEE